MTLKNRQINILISIDDNYIEHALNLIYSISINNKTYINLYLIYGDELSVTSIKIIKDFLPKNNYGKLVTIYFDKKDNNLPKTIDYISITTYFRLFAPFLIKNKIDRILYLDCDIICNGSIIKFYQTNFDDNIIVACPNMLPPNLSEWGKRNNIRIGLSRDYTYINTGVLLINIDKYKKFITAKQIYNFINKISNILLFQDQDVINMLFHNKIKIADNKYNYQINPSKTIPQNPKLIHYSEKLKPWNNNYNSPEKAIFYYKILSMRKQYNELQYLI